MSRTPNPRRDPIDADLPDFERPPLAEVVLGVQFDPLVRLGAPHMGSIWNLYRKEFPRTEDRRPIPATFEQFGGPTEGSEIELNLDLIARPQAPRCWFINESGSEVLQIQSDRFHHNWRSTEQKHEYPRYELLRKRFERELSRLEALITSEKIGNLVPNQCEVTYINHITAEEVWEEHSDAGKVFRLLVDAAGVPLAAQPEHVRFDTAFLIRDKTDMLRGRLHVSISSGFLKPSGAPMFAMTLTARGSPIGDGLDGVLKFLDLGRRWVVRGFADMTTESMHAVWGIKRK